MTQALGIMEVRSLARAIDAANLAVNSAAVDIHSTSYALPGVVMIAVEGPVDAVSAAVHAVRAKLEPEGGLHGWTILARPDEAVDSILAQRAVRIGERAGAPSIPGRGLMYAPAVADQDATAPDGTSSTRTRKTTSRTTKKTTTKPADQG